jgi:hypothetical protein
VAYNLNQEKSMPAKALSAQCTEYSEKIAGAPSNYNWPVRFDWTRGHIGITQFDDKNQDAVRDRVLLSPAQVRELLAFIEATRS